MKKTLTVQLKNGAYVRVGSAAFKEGRRRGAVNTRYSCLQQYEQFTDWVSGMLSRPTRGGPATLRASIKGA